MNDVIELYGFADVDRSGKVRWAAAELDLAVEERRISPPEHRRPDYLALNPLGQVPTVRFRGEVYIESTAIIQVLADAVDEPRLEIARGEDGRADYLFWMAAFTETMEGRLVECAVSRAGILGPEYFELHEAQLRRKLAVLAERLPNDGYLAGRFSLADICAGYSLRLAIQCGLLDRAATEPYLSRLIARPAARRSRMFASLKE